MKVFQSSAAASAFCKKGSVVTIGNFDGIHLGHQALVKKAVAEARRKKIKSVVLTFEPHPVQVLAPQVAPLRLNTPRQKLEMLQKLKVDTVVIEKFTATFARQSALDFFNKCLIQRLKCRTILVGYNFTFGAKRQGTIETLEVLGFQSRVGIRIVEPYLAHKTLVSSSLIRKLVGEGKMEEATRLLGRHFYLEGIVEKGFQRGSQIGIPTINLKTQQECLPQSGVYATWTQIGKKIFKSVTNVGSNPTFGNQSLSVETHVLHFNKRIYGKSVSVLFVKKLRDEIKFAHADDLKKQISRDIKLAAKYLKGAHP